MASKQRSLCAAVVLTCILMTTIIPSAGADYLTQWSGNSPALGVVVNSYPEFVAGESCVAPGSIVYCMGGLNGTAQPTDTTYAASLTPLGVGQWGRLGDYPTDIAGESCVSDSGYVYCIGGLEREASSSSASDVVSASYYAPLTATGLGKWTRTTAYPFGVFDQSCTVSAGSIYCVGGIASNFTGMSAVEFAQLSPSGISQWNPATSYPLSVSAGSCGSYAGRIYCVGGLNGTSRAISSVYHARLTGGNLTWTRETSYPNPVAGHSCFVHYPGLYCVGGLNATAYATRSVFFTYLNGTGLRWIPSTFYPIDVQSQSCITHSSFVYCVGGYDGQSFLASVYYSTIGASGGNSSVASIQSSTSNIQALPAGGPVPWLADYGWLIVGAGVAAAVLAASLASKRKFVPAQGFPSFGAGNDV